MKIRQLVDFYLSLDTVTKNMRGARVILLTINLLCAFLFLLIFEMVFGWQFVRPDSSNTMFVHNLSTLVSMKNNGNSELTVYETEVLNYADHFYNKIATTNNSNLSFLRERLQDSLDTEKIWLREEWIKLFVTGLDSLNSRFSKKMAADDNGDNRFHYEFSGNSLKIEGTIKKEDSTSSDFGYLILSNPGISFALNEIRDRHYVNMETSGQRMGRRIYTMPLIGIPIQVEDISVPIGLFLLLLMYWLHTSLIRALDSVEIYRDVYDRHDKWKYNPDPELTRLYKKVQIKRLVNVVQFISMKKDGPNIKKGIIYLIFVPYFVIISSILANLHEFFTIDIRIHGSGYIFLADTTLSLLFTQAVQVIIGLAVLHYSKRILNSFLAIHGIVVDKYYRISGSISLADKETENVRISEIKRHAQLWFKYGFVWLLLFPFTIFGIYNLIYFGSAGYEASYILDWGNLFIYLLLIGLFVFLAQRLIKLAKSNMKDLLRYTKFYFQLWLGINVIAYFFFLIRSILHNGCENFIPILFGLAIPNIIPILILSYALYDLAQKSNNES